MKDRVKPKRIVVAISGTGRTLVNLLSKETHPTSHYKVVGVITSNMSCRGSLIAKSNDLPLFYSDFKPQNIKTTLSELTGWLSQQEVDWIALGGFLKVFPTQHYLSKNIINIHPALLPKYGGKGMYGMRVHEKVVANRDRVSGATVHFVNARYDDGRIIAQVEVDILPGDSAETVAQKVFKAECDLYPKVLNGLITGTLPLNGDQVYRYKYTI